MALLEEIQAAAVDSNSDLGATLRKCKLLAARLNSRVLEDWLIWESNGYPDEIEVPDYRIWPLELKGHFAGPFHSGMRNAPIPKVCLPAEVRQSYNSYKCRQSIASIERMLTNTDGSTRLHVPTGDLAVYIGQTVYQNQNCVQAWAEFGEGNLLELLNTVRNRVLDFSLAIWKEDPMAGEAGSKNEPTIDPSRVTQIFNTTVYGGAANLVGSADRSNVSFHVNENDFSSLQSALAEHQVTSDDISALKEAIEEDELPSREGGFGPRVSEWIGRMVAKAADGSWNIGVGAAGNVLASIISTYYGI